MLLSVAAGEELVGAEQGGLVGVCGQRGLAEERVRAGGVTAGGVDPGRGGDVADEADAVQRDGAGELPSGGRGTILAGDGQNVGGAEVVLSLGIEADTPADALGQPVDGPVLALEQLVERAAGRVEDAIAWGPVVLGVRDPGASDEQVEGLVSVPELNV